MRRCRFAGRYEIVVPFEITAYSEEEAKERLLRLDPSVEKLDTDFCVEYSLRMVRAVEA